MAADKVGVDQPKLETMAAAAAAGFADSPVHFKILQFPAKCAAKVLPGSEAQPPAAAGSAPGLQTSSPSVVVIAKAPAPTASAKGPPQMAKAVLNQVTSLNQLTTLGRMVMITVPRSTAPPQNLSLTPHMPPSTSSHQANIQIPPGMVLIRSESGQLMLVSQQALTQSQQGPASVGGPMSTVLAQQVSAAVANKSNEKVTVFRMALPAPGPTGPSAAGQKSTVVKVVGVASNPATQSGGAVSSKGNQSRLQTTETAKEPAATFSQETLESVKKCKNFLVTLIKLASSDPQAAGMANNVRVLVRDLLEGKMEAEQFTEQLYQELKSTPQPCLVPFLKKSLPAVRHLTADPHLFIQQAASFTPTTTMLSSSIRQSNADKNLGTSQQVVQRAGGEAVKARTTLSLLRGSSAKNSRPDDKLPVAPSGKHLTGTFPAKLPLSQYPSRTPAKPFKDSFGTYKEDDDINDVASMAGVNLREENAQILTSTVGSVVQSCQDQLFLSSNLLLSRILHAGRPLGVTDVASDVVALVSHATQECLHGLILKLTVLAGHRTAAVKEDQCHTKVSDVRAQLRFLEEVEALKKRRNDEEERERLLRLARSRSHSEDPQHQQLKQRAKELQQMEEAELQQREANLTALAAIGPRRRRPPERPEGQVAVLPRPGLQRGTRITLRDLLLCMELDPFLCHSLLLYKAML